MICFWKISISSSWGKARYSKN